jgi:hypothetical protein
LIVGTLLLLTPCLLTHSSFTIVTMSGLVHNWFEYHTLGSGPLYALSRFAVSLMNTAWANDAMLEWFKTGRFTYEYPLGLGKLDRQVCEGPPPMDFIGLNYYSR